MRRRAFLANCAAGAVAAAAATTTGAQPRPKTGGPEAARAIEALVASKRLQVSGNYDRLRQTFHSEAMVVEPASLEPSLGRAEIVDSLSRSAEVRKLLYFYYRQPQVLLVGNGAVVVSNYESGHSAGERTVEHTGKSSSVVLLGSDPPLIALEVLVPNLQAGSYGALGTALASPLFGLYPLRALGPSASRPGPQSAGGGENDVLYGQVEKINNAWRSGNTSELLGYANPAAVFLIGDYSPYFITGDAAIKEHFADFYKTGKVSMIRSLDPQVRIWGSVAAVAFNFDLDYTVNSRARRSPGRGVYTFVRGGSATLSDGSMTSTARVTPGTQWLMAACAATHLVMADIGDPYPTTPPA